MFQKIIDKKVKVWYNLLCINTTIYSKEYGQSHRILGCNKRSTFCYILFVSSISRNDIMTIKTAPGQFSAHVHLMDRHRHRNEKSTVQIPANTLVFLNRAFCFVCAGERC